tara:strand:+ start:359 stop:607 length:249 start_codon:yes stop_codon:yes gene_type:complete
MTTYKIKLNQFDNYKTCSWVRGLISLSTDFFKKSKIMNGCLFLEGGNNNSLNMLNEASNMDFSYDTLGASINEVEKYLKAIS